MARRDSNFRPGLFFLALIMALVLWGMAHGASSVERGYDIPVAFHGLPEKLVITDQSTELVNIRVLGSRAALRDLSPTKMEYVVDVSGSKPGLAIYDVEGSHIELPRGARLVSRSPAHIEVRFENRGRKSVKVQPVIEGQVPEGYELGEVTVEPARVWLVGARSKVLRISEIATEAIDVSQLTAPVEREVRVALGSGPVWTEKDEPVRVKIDVRSTEVPEEQGGGEAATGGQAGQGAG